MSFWKRICAGTCALILLLQTGPVLPAKAEGEDPDFTDTEYWNSLCTSTEGLSQKEISSCRAYTEYMQKKNADLESEITEIGSRKEELSETIADYQNQIASYNTQITGITGMIDDLNAQITAMEEQIADIQATIETNKKAIRQKQDDIDALKEKVAERMTEEQKTMRTYQFLDVLMGASSFDDFIRLANGISDIYEYDSHSLAKLNDSVAELNELEASLLADQQEITAMEADLETGRQMMNAQQAALLSSRADLQSLQDSYSQQLAGAESELADAENAIAANQSTIGDIKDSIANQPTATPTAAPASSASAAESTAAPAAETASAAAATPTPSAASSTPTPSSASSSSVTTPETGNTSANPYYGGWSNCAWGAWQLVYDTLGIALPGWGMAGSWLSDAARDGYATGSTPKVYSIAVYSWHVAFVTAVDGDMVYIKEGNYLGHYYERWVPADGLPYTGQTCLGYIYL